VENMICHIGELTLEASMHGRVPPRYGNRSPDFAPQGCYRCAGEDAWVVLSVRNDHEWHRLRKVIGSSMGLDSPETESLAGRIALHDTIDAAISAWTVSHKPMEAATILQEAGVPAGPVLTEAEACSDPHLHERGFFHPLAHRSCGVHMHPGANFQMELTPPVMWRAAPTLGQDNEYVYKSILGVSDDEYAELESEGHIGTSYV